MNLQQIKNICTDIKSDDEWVNDSHTSAEHKGVICGLDQLVRHLEEVKPKETDVNILFVQELLDDLVWDAQRMSRSGRATLNALLKHFNMEPLNSEYYG